MKLKVFSAIVSAMMLMPIAMSAESAKHAQIKDANVVNLADVYVDEVNGDDENDGSIDAPVKTLATAVAKINHGFNNGPIGYIRVVGTVHADGPFSFDGGTIGIAGVDENSVIEGASDGPLYDGGNKNFYIKDITLRNFKARAIAIGGGNFTAINVTVEDCTDAAPEGYASRWANWGGMFALVDVGWAKIIDCKFINNTGVQKASAIAAVNVGTKDNTTFEITNTVFEGNTTSTDGAIVLYNTPHAFIDGCTFKQNVAKRGPALFMENANINLTLTNTLFEGNTSTLTDDNDGGAIFYANGTVAISDCEFTGNTARRGAAIFDNSSTPMTITNCKFNENTAKKNGGVFCLFNNGTINVSNSTFADNESEDTAGVINIVAGTLNAESCEFTGNKAKNGGVIRQEGTSTLNINKCVFEGNSVSEQGGVGYFYNQFNLMFDQCLFKGNSSVGQGGAMFIHGDHSGDAVKVMNSTFLSNSATNHGGAISFLRYSPTTIDFINTTFYDNANTAAGACIFFTGGSGAKVDVRFYNCTLTGNHTSSNAGNSSGFSIIGDNYKFKIYNTILESNPCGNGQWGDINLGVADLHTTQIELYNSVIGRVVSAGNEITGEPLVCENSMWNFQPNMVNQGGENYCGLAAYNTEINVFPYANESSVGTTFGNLNYLPEGVTTDQLGKPRTLPYIGAVQLLASELVETGIEGVETDAAGIKVNANGGNIEVALGAAAADVAVVVYNVAGQAVAYAQAADATVVAVGEELAAGIYVVAVVADGKPYAAKVAVK